MLDTNIPLQGKTLDTATPIYQAQEQEAKMRLAAEQTLKAHYDNMDAREKSRLTSVVSGAAQLKTFLDNDDLEGAHSFLQNRRNALSTRMAHGESIDTQETDAALQMVRSGNIDELRNNVNGLLAAGQVYGILSSKDMPSNVQEWQYYNKLPDDQKKQYLEMKRQGQVMNLGGTMAVRDPVSGGTKESFPVTPKPEDDPNFKAKQAAATAMGTAQGQAKADLPAAEMDADQMLGAINELRGSPGLPAIVGMPNPMQGGLGVANVSGSPAADAQAKLDRVKGQTFLLAYQKLKGGGAITEVEGKKGESAVARLQTAQSEEAFNTALDDLELVVRRGLERQKQKANNSYDSALPEGPVTQRNPGMQLPGGKVTVTNGRETYQIDAADLPHAQAEGFQVKK